MSLLPLLDLQLTDSLLRNAMIENSHLASVMFDKGFNVQDLFLPYQVKLIIPPFVCSKRQFTPSEVTLGKRIATADIQIEQVMGRFKEFR